MFVRFSIARSSNVPLIFNLRNGYISPQFRVVFDDDFSTASSIISDNEPPSFWNTIDLEHNTLRIHLDTDSPIFLGKEWLTPSELEEQPRSNIKQSQPRKSFHSDSIVHDEPSDETSNYSEESFDTPLLSQGSVPMSVFSLTSDSSPSPSPRRSDIPNKETCQSVSL